MKQLRRLLILAVLLAAVVLVVALQWPRLQAAVSLLSSAGSIQDVQVAVRSLGVWGPIVSILLMVLHTIIFVPSEVITLANVAVFGPLLGVVYTWIGAMLGAFLAFYLARAFGRPLAARFIPARVLDRLDSYIKENGSLGLIGLRLIPLVSFNALNYASGLTPMSKWQFAWTTGLGILPATIALAYLYQAAQARNTVFAALTAAGVLVLLFIVAKPRLERWLGLGDPPQG